MNKLAKDRRYADRKMIEPLEVSSLSSLENLAKIAKHGLILEASSSGFLLKIKRTDLVPQALRSSLTLESLHGNKIILHLPQMNLEISGKVARTRLLGKQGFEIAIDYTDDSPEYWRECLMDLLPSPGEFDDN
jgi:hypothetical protein